MTTPAQPPVDTGNNLLGVTPAQCMTALLELPGVGQRLALTIRTPSTTLTVLLTKADADTWAANIALTAKQMSDSGLIVAGPGAIGNGSALGQQSS